MSSQKGLLLSSGKHFYMCYDLEVHFSIGKKLKEDMRLNWKLPIGHSLLLKELSEKTMLILLRPHSFRDKIRETKLLGHFFRKPTYMLIIIYQPRTDSYFKYAPYLHSMEILRFQKIQSSFLGPCVRTK